LLAATLYQGNLGTYIYTPYAGVAGMMPHMNGMFKM
jgi:hypothetical protein